MEIPPIRTRLEKFFFLLSFLSSRLYLSPIFFIKGIEIIVNKKLINIFNKKMWLGFINKYLTLNLQVYFISNINIFNIY